MVLTLAIPLRKLYGLEDFITMRHLDNMAKVMLATGLIVAYGYAMETLHRLVQRQQLRGVHDDATGSSGRTAWSTGLLILCNVLRPAAALVQAGAAEHLGCSSCISIVVNVGMWLERFVIVVTSLHRDFLPSSWGMYYADRLGLGHVLGTIGLFFCAVLPLHPVPADDLDLRDAARCSPEPRGEERRHQRRTRRMSHDVRRIYGLMAEFDDSGGRSSPPAADGARDGLPRDRRLHALSRSRS